VPLDHVAFLAAIERGEVQPVVLLHGREPTLAEDALGRLVRTVMGGEGGDVALARETVDVREAGVDAAVRAARTLPFLVHRRIVVARGAETLTEQASATLLEYARSPSPTSVLVLLAERELASGHWLVEALPSAAVVQLTPPTGRGLVGWLRARGRAAGIDLAEDAAQMLVDLVGDEPGALVTELEKAALVGGPDNRRVGAREVEDVVGARRARPIFELLRALEARDRGGALAVLQALLDAGEEPLGLLGMLAREARVAWQVKEWRRVGRPPEEIARRLRRPPWVATALVARADARAPGEAPRDLVRCWETERRLKLGANARAELTLLVADLCGS
jgi:DNA polymerase III subunit delta